ncbi:unnamed protein product [Orchesella dallaii]|uniref:C2H2-type domain-containing protein n=1 Tax=Orchesella dallaii TaxID=48710 RepID=A0ABP1PWQ3_9HEXA
MFSKVAFFSDPNNLGNGKKLKSESVMDSNNAEDNHDESQGVSPAIDSDSVRPTPIGQRRFYNACKMPTRLTTDNVKLSRKPYCYQCTICSEYFASKQQTIIHSSDSSVGTSTLL